VSEEVGNTQSEQTVFEVPSHCAEDIDLESINVVSNTNCRVAEPSLSSSGLLSVLWSQDSVCSSSNQALSSGAYAGIGVAVAILVIVVLGGVIFMFTWYPRYGFLLNDISRSTMSDNDL
jgi:hypothetical protein